jgi:hypothetical protein
MSGLSALTLNPSPTGRGTLKSCSPSQASHGNDGGASDAGGFHLPPETEFLATTPGLGRCCSASRRSCNFRPFRICSTRITSACNLAPLHLPLEKETLGASSSNPTALPALSIISRDRSCGFEGLF